MPPGKRTPTERSRDIQLQLRLRLSKKPAGEIIAEVNEFRRSEAERQALEQGMPPEHAAAFAREAMLSPRQLRADMRRAMRGLLAEERGLGKALLQDRLDELELEYRTLLLLEQRAWEELDRSAGEAVGRRQQRENRDPSGNKRTVQEEARQRPRAADPRWHQRIVDTLWRRVELGREMTVLRAQLGIEAPADLARRAAGGDAAASDQLRAHEVAQLYSFEARALGIDTAEAEARLRLVMGYLGDATKARANRGGEPARTVTWAVVSAELPAEGPAEVDVTPTKGG